MSTSQQKQQYILPNMPFHRDINNGLSVGSSVQLTAKPYQDKNKFAQLRLITNNSDVALRINLELGPSAKVKIDCTVGQKTSTNIENAVSLPFQQIFILCVRTLQHSFQIYINGSKIADFVHRVDPTLVRNISVEGPLICDEVVVDPNAAALPTYAQATTSPPTDLLRNLNLNANPNLDSVTSTAIPSAPSAPHDLPPPPPSVLGTAGSGAIPSVPSAPSNSSGTSNPAPFFYSGGSQGFSNHPYPLPGMMDNNTYPSQQHQANPLPQKTAVPSSTQAAPYPQPTNTHTTTATNANAGAQPRPPYPPADVSAAGYMSPPVATPVSQQTQPYTVTYPPSLAGTPIAPPPPLQQQHQQAQQQSQRYPPQQQHPYYQNQPPFNAPYPPQQQPMPHPPQVNIGMGVSPAQMPPVQPTMSVQPFIPPVAPVAPPMPPTYIYPTATQYVQPTVYPYQQYYQPGMVYYDTDYYGHHHHHHRHHHHC